MAYGTWADDERDLIQANYSAEDIAQEKQRQYDELTSAGYDQKDIDEYFGTKQPDLDPVKQMVQDNYSKYVLNADKEVKDFFDFFDRVVMGKDPNPKEDKVSAGEAFKEGFTESVPVMQYKAAHGNSVLSENNLPPEYFDSFDRAAKMAGTLAGDMPYMIAGAAAATVATSAAIAAAPVAIPAGLATAAVVAAGGFGAGALPAFLRSHLVNFYEKGEVKDFSDFWERLTSVVVDTGKEGTINAATEYVGGKVGAKVLGKTGSYVASRVSSAGSEIATMVGMKSAIEGEVPNMQEFQDAAILVAGLSGSTYTANKLFKIYKDTGVRPAKVAELAKTNQSLSESLKSANDNVPLEILSTLTPIEQATNVSEILKKNALELSGEKLVDNTNKVELTPAQRAEQKIRKSIGVEEKTIIKDFYNDVKNIKSAKGAYVLGKKVLSGPVASFGREFYSAYVNRFYPIQEVSKKGFEKYKLLSGASGITQTFVDSHTIDFTTGRANGESFANIIKDVGDVVGFENYLVAARKIELAKRGIEQIKDLTIEEADALLKRDSHLYEKHAQRFYDFNNRVMEYVQKSGRFSEDDIKVIQAANKSHISFKKIIDEMNTSVGAKSKNPYKKIGSSDLQIRNPLISTLDNLDSAIKLAQMNSAKLSFINDAVSKEIAEKVKQPKRIEKITEEEVAKYFKEQGIDADPESFSIFRQARSNLKENEIELYRDGKREVYEIKDEVLAKAVKSFEENPFMQSTFFNVARVTTTAFKFGTTGIPDFVIQNLGVDTLTSMVKSSNLKEFDISSLNQAAKEQFGIVKSLIQKDALWYDYLSSGASGSAWTDAERALLKITEGKYNTSEWSETRSKVRNTIDTAKDYYELSQLISEHYVRLKKFKEVIDSGKSKTEAAIAAKEETLDFSQRGYSKALANMSAITAFQNVAIQGADNFARTVGKDPKKIAINGTALLTLPTIALFVANYGDERVDERPEWEKLTYWHLATDDWQSVSNEFDMAEANALMALEKHSNQVRTLDDGTIQINKGIIFKIKKPPVYGEIFATLPDVLLSKFFKDNKSGFNEFSKSFISNAIPSIVPNIAVPVVEQFANKSFFTGNQIIPYTMEKTSPELQYTEYTNESARALGKLIESMPIVGDAAKQMNLSSPVILENYIRQWTGGGGMYLLQLASKATPQEAYQKYDIQPELKKPASTLADIPFIKRFVSRNPSASMKSITDFSKYYEKYAQLEADSNIERSRWNFENFSYLKQQQLDSFAPIKGIADAIKNQTALIHITNKRPDLNETEKRQLIDATYYQMLGLSQQGLEMIRQFEEEKKQYKEMGIEQ